MAETINQTRGTYRRSVSVSRDNKSNAYFLARLPVIEWPFSEWCRRLSNQAMRRANVSSWPTVRIRRLRRTRANGERAEPTRTDPDRPFNIADTGHSEG
jgi:hypothetical protein